jgi:prepilin-type N-terminal cleavage/methylation domain-containing protein
MNHKVKQDGFTLIELLLAMTFISVLLLTIAMTIVQIANIYNRGIILKEVNATSRALGDELDSATRSSSTFSIDPAAKRYVTNAWGGRMCLGQYTYVWNYGSALASVNSNRNQYSGPNTSGNSVIDSNGTTRYEISFVKAPDSGGAYCIPDGNGKYPNINPVGAVELLRSGDHSLAIHAFSVVSSSTSKDALSAQQLYKITYTLGTSDLNALTSDQSACKPPSSSGSDLNYCAVQQFTLVLRVVSGVN